MLKREFIIPIRAEFSVGKVLAHGYKIKIGELTE